MSYISPMATKELEMSLPNNASTQQLFNACCANGGVNEDHSALVKSIELMANHTLTQ